MTKDVRCSCGVLIAMAPMAGDTQVLVPVDRDSIGSGDLTVVHRRAGYSVRLAEPGDDSRMRRVGHWATCSDPTRWRGVQRALGMDVPDEAGYDSRRSGPCARCHEVHAWHYGGPVATKVCDRCRRAEGRPLVGEPY